MTQNHRKDYWSTADEIEFIKDLGTGKLSDKALPAFGVNRLKFLAGYKISLNGHRPDLGRKDWNKVAVKEVVKFLNYEIEKEARK